MKQLFVLKKLCLKLWCYLNLSDFQPVIMSGCCYIIYSRKINRFYVGACQGNLDDRIQKHNSHYYGSHRFTAVASDWELYLEIPANDFAHATRMEKAVKRMKSSIYIKNLKKYPELINKLIRKTSN
ncbi:MAG: GIY-YIG nuclease family protein [Bacteroidales bacterium]